ncbi:hypothetical protein [Streptacidiphilus melanogenes]|uniref:hypothetical protein n=1 Tax=Streptacidiphilus melanogenes TaxID=411235 RepID=UPI0005A650FF|nr:hypothetical protein [Streptacidiphilus melanogenes]
MTDHPRGASFWAKDRAAAAFAGALVFFLVQAITLPWTKQAVPDYAYTAAFLIAAPAAVLGGLAARRIMKRLP